MDGVNEVGVCADVLGPLDAAGLDVREVGDGAGDDLGGVVGGGVVEHDHFHLGGQGGSDLRQDGPQGAA